MSFRDAIALDHLDRMTDSTGLIQHAIYSLPRRKAVTRPTITHGPCDFVHAFGIGTRTTACSTGSRVI